MFKMYYGDVTELIEEAYSIQKIHKKKEGKNWLQPNGRIFERSIKNRYDRRSPSAKRITSNEDKLSRVGVSREEYNNLRTVEIKLDETNKNISKYLMEI